MQITCKEKPTGIRHNKRVLGKCVIALRDVDLTSSSDAWYHLKPAEIEVHSSSFMNSAWRYLINDSFYSRLNRLENREAIQVIKALAHAAIIVSLLKLFDATPLLICIKIKFSVVKTDTAMWMLEIPTAVFSTSSINFNSFSIFVNTCRCFDRQQPLVILPLRDPVQK